MTPDDYCQQKAAQSGSSFYYSFLFLPPNKRRAITALYAFCREVDDVVDECPDAQIAATKLAWWRHELASVYRGSPQHPVTLALQSAQREFDLPEEQLQEIIDGMEMDLRQSRSRLTIRAAPACITSSIFLFTAPAYCARPFCWPPPARCLRRC
jgi:phytoene synthase